MMIEAHGLQYLASVFAAARRGSDEALGKLFLRYQKVLLRIAARELPPDLRSKCGASDLVQETFLEAQRDFPRFEGTTDAELFAWLKCVLKNNSLNFVRDYRRRQKRAIRCESPLWTDSGRIAAGQEPVAAGPGPQS